MPELDLMESSNVPVIDQIRKWQQDLYFYRAFLMYMLLFERQLLQFKANAVFGASKTQPRHKIGSFHRELLRTECTNTRFNFIAL